VIFRAVMNGESGKVVVDNFMSAEESEDGDLDVKEPVLLRVSINADDGYINLKLNSVDMIFFVSPAVTDFKITQVRLTGNLLVRFFGFVKKGTILNPAVCNYYFFKYIFLKNRLDIESSRGIRGSFLLPWLHIKVRLLIF